MRVYSSIWGVNSVLNDWMIRDDEVEVDLESSLSFGGMLAVGCCDDDLSSSFGDDGIGPLAM